MRRLQLPRCSFREDADPADMAGAIFMSNSETREHCFGTGVFGLPPEYERFVARVRQGMPLFLFDYTERKLYGVFEATSDGGMDIRRGAFRFTGRTYPAQVCFSIVWKCRPLTEDEFFPAIEDNYYISKKFYFDLSCQQVVNLYGLFDKKRVPHPVSNYSTRAYLEKEHSSRGRPDKRSLSPNVSPLSADQSHSLIPSSSAVETNCSASTSMHPIVPHSFEAQPNVSMPLVTEPFGVQTAPIHSKQLKLPYYSHEDLRDVPTITQVAAACSQTRTYHGDQFVANQSYPLSHDYLQNRLSSGCSTQGPTDGVRLSLKQPYEGSSSLYSRYSTQLPTGDDRSYLTPYVPSYPHLSQHNANLEDDYDNCEQCKAIYASEHRHLNRAKSLTPELTQQGIPAYPEAPEVSAISQQKECFAGYIPIPDCAEDFEKDQPRRDFNRDVSGSSGSGHDTGAYMSNQPYTNHDVGAESNITVPSQRQQKTVFSRLSMKPQPLPQEIPGPSLNQLLYSLSKRTEQWSSKTRSPTEDVCKQLVRAQDIDRPYAPSELNLPTELEEESVDPPFLNFKRRSKAASLDANGGNEGSVKPKRRKLVRPSFGQSNSTASSGKELQENAVVEMNHSPAKTVGKELQENVIMEMTNTSVETVGNKLKENVTMERYHSPVKTGGNDFQENVIMEMTHTHVKTVENKLQENVMMERNHSPVETGGNKFYIDLNEPASVDSDLVEDASIVTPPPVAVKTQIVKPTDVDINQLSCSNSKEVNSKQDQSSGSGAPTEKITLDLNITDLNTMDEAKLQAILGSSLLQALDKLRNGKSNDSEKANKSSLCGKNSVVKMEVKADTSTNRRCN
ncbi:uncharacterized protein [Lolium perenne]|uniref:uncharacterized protein n=1 Tax=Lolium perenne TaxID=4522 RepID=UPI0021F5FC12|nr:uncharacterized protein LOC127303020 isoform X1 [Lolium perenne]